MITTRSAVRTVLPKLEAVSAVETIITTIAGATVLPPSDANKGVTMGTAEGKTTTNVVIETVIVNVNVSVNANVNVNVIVIVTGVVTVIVIVIVITETATAPVAHARGAPPLHEQLLDEFPYQETCTSPIPWSVDAPKMSASRNGH